MTFYQVLSDHSLTDFTDLHCNSAVNREYLTSIMESFILCKNNMSLPTLPSSLHNLVVHLNMTFISSSPYGPSPQKQNHLR